MVLIPAPCAFFRQAEPVSESRLTMSRTLTPALIMLSQIVPNFVLSPFAFWMSEPMPAASKAALRYGRSLASHRGEVDASGRITPTLPLAAAGLELLPPDPPELLSLLPPHAASVSALATVSTASPAVVLRICPPVVARSPYRPGGRGCGETDDGPGPGRAAPGTAPRERTAWCRRDRSWSCVVTPT